MAAAADSLRHTKSRRSVTTLRQMDPVVRWARWSDWVDVLVRPSRTLLMVQVQMMTPLGVQLTLPETQKLADCPRWRKKPAGSRPSRCPCLAQPQAVDMRPEKKKARGHQTTGTSEAVNAAGVAGVADELGRARPRAVSSLTRRQQTTCEAAGAARQLRWLPGYRCCSRPNATCRCVVPSSAL